MVPVKCSYTDGFTIIQSPSSQSVDTNDLPGFPIFFKCYYSNAAIIVTDILIVVINPVLLGKCNVYHTLFSDQCCHYYYYRHHNCYTVISISNVGWKRIFQKIKEMGEQVRWVVLVIDFLVTEHL